MNFVSYQTLNAWTLEFTRMIPNEYDLIAGIPRGGLVLASILATKFGRPLAVPDTPSVWAPGVKRVLICDDSISSGSQMKAAVKLMRTKYPNASIDTAAVIKHAESEVTYSYKVTTDPKLFEWNLAHVKQGRLACDIDGVMCNDLPVGFEEEENPKGYEDHIKNAAPQFVPGYVVDVVVSCRVERWRVGTEAWLQKVGVRYDELKMWDVGVPSERNGHWEEYKVEQIRDTNVDYVIESNWGQAQSIHNALKIPVLCFENMVMLGAKND